MIKSLTKIKTYKRNFSNPGEKFEEVYKLVIEDGEKKFKQVDVRDIRKEIGKHEPSVNLHRIIDRYMLGDESAIERASGFYADISDLPYKLQDVMNINQEGKRIFDRLPVDVKELFNNDYLDFVTYPEKLDEYVKKNYPQSVNNEVEKNDSSEQGTN